jgi:hypothetical protein
MESPDIPGRFNLIIGAAGGSAVGTLVERSNRFTILLHLPGRHDAESVAAAMIREMRRLPEYLRRSITWADRLDPELATLDGVVAVFVDEPHERGDGRSSSAAKKADAAFKIAFARRSSRFSASSPPAACARW